MNALRIRHVRCFANPGPRPLRKVTFLVGENSTGKSTFLNLIRLAWDVGYGYGSADFNEPPFSLGAYDQIAHYRGGRGGRAKDFEIGFDASDPRSGTLTYAAQFGNVRGQPALRSQSLKTKSFTLRYGADGDTPAHLVLETEGTTERIAIDSSLIIARGASEGPLDWRYVHYALQRALATRKQSPPARLDRVLSALGRILNAAHLARPVALAPVRTKPRRTYDPIREVPDAEGGHVPMVLARTYHGDRSRWDSLKAALDDFGQASGLFRDIAVKSLGPSGNAVPFQLLVEVGGPASNLIDVGYGVSQVLPILVEALSGSSKRLLLLQQPEVHLHPRAQAALGSFFARTAAETGTRFVIETHSDHLIDRVRMDVRDRRELAPEDVAILYFERKDLEVTIHDIQIDREGNLVNPPDGFREFFMTEERRLLGV